MNNICTKVELKTGLLVAFKVYVLRGRLHVLTVLLCEFEGSIKMGNNGLDDWSKDAITSLHELIKLQSLIEYFEGLLFREKMEYENLMRKHNLLYPHHRLDFINKRQGE
jgi:hypothetical protein